jgi:hypothetical protein
MWTAKTELKEKAFGKPLSLLYKLGWYWCYFATAQKKKGEEIAQNDDDDGSNFVTIQATIMPTLIAVTPKQLKGWAKQGMKYKHHWEWVNKLIAKRIGAS